MDDDDDGNTDCNDANCSFDSTCVVDCAAAPRCGDLLECCFLSVPDNCGPGCTCSLGLLWSCASLETDCNDGADNDHDGQTDCSDDDCATGPPCCSGLGTSCGWGSKDCCAGLTCSDSLFGTCQ